MDIKELVSEAQKNYIQKEGGDTFAIIYKKDCVKFSPSLWGVSSELIAKYVQAYLLQQYSVDLALIWDCLFIPTLKK